MTRRQLHPLPHLVGAMQLSGPHNLCIHRAAGFVIDTPGSALCFGTFDPDPAVAWPGDCDVPMIHAWPEWRGKAYAVSTIERNGGLYSEDAAVYYEVNRASNVKRLKRQDVLKIARAIGLSRHLLYGEPATTSVGGAFLGAAGVDYIVSEDGGILPRAHGSQDHD